MTENGDTLLLGVADAAKLLGISKGLAYDLIAEGRLPHVRLGRRVLVPRQGLEDWIARESQLSPDPQPVVSSAQE